jgi:hypothetical protein
VKGGFAPIVLKKSFLGDERDFLEPLMHFMRGDVRDHIVSRKSDHGPSYRRKELCWSSVKNSQVIDLET